MQASVELQILVVIAVVAAAAVTVLKVQEDKRIRDIALWLRQRYPESWARLPWIVRTANRSAAVEAFRTSPEIDDPELERRCAEARRTRRWQSLALVIAAVAIGLGLLGDQLFDWTLTTG